ncbi:MAG: phosphoserine phosphatase SerB [Burkholderiaceae bacterium]
MNLVISGPIDANLRNALGALVKPRSVVRLHAQADRFEAANESAECREAVAKLCEASRVDYAYVEAGAKLSDFKLLAMDMDSTLITIECIDEIADFAGKKKEVAAITEAAMRGEIADFAESLRRRVALLAGTPITVLQRVYDERLALSEGAEALMTAAQAAGIKTLLVSGGFSFFSDKLKARLGFDYSNANHLETVSGLLTGKVSSPIIDAGQKASSVQTALAFYPVEQRNAIVIGDGANDLQMMALASASIAFHAKEIVRKSTNYQINFGGLDTVLYWFSQY